VIEEAKRLVASGYREIVLTGIETSAYNGAPLPQLIGDLSRLREEGLARVRLGSYSVGTFRHDFYEAIASSENFMPHLHLSLQSGSNRILRLMRRPYTSEIAMEKIKQLRSVMPHVQLSADFITGFPTETEEDYLETEAFVREAGLMHVHAFPYSERVGTPASEMEGAVPKEIRKSRCQRLNQASNQQRDIILDTFVSKTVSVLVEKITCGKAVGHTEEFLECTFAAETAAVGDLASVTVLGHENGRLTGKEI
jgi:threonylcarbamoyladenosine tRNA methylthiotransferase MtaB